MEGTITVASIISVLSEIFTAAIGWVGTVAETIAGEPLLLFGVVFGFAFVGVGLFKRLLHV